MPFRLPFAPAAGLFALLVTSSAVAQDTGNRATGIDALWAYAGTWKIETERFDTAYGKAGHESATLHNDCWDSGPYLACRQIVDGDSKALLVFTYDPASRAYTSYPIPPDGGETGRGKLLIEGNTWTFPWQTTDSGKTTWFRVVNVWAGTSAIDFRQEFSTDQVHWTRISSGHEVKIGQ